MTRQRDRVAHTLEGMKITSSVWICGWCACQVARPEIYEQLEGVEWSVVRDGTPGGEVKKPVLPSTPQKRTTISTSSLN